MATYDITEFGAVADGRTNNAAAVQRAVDACRAAGGGRVLVPCAGDRAAFLTGSVCLKSCVELHVESGATLLASGRIDDHAEPAHRDAGTGRACIVADGAEHVAVTGGGVIDGNGRAYVTAFDRYIYRTARERPQLISLSGCRNVTFRDVTLRDGASWTLHLSGCEDVLVSGIRILNDLRMPNCDGIDPDHCRNVRISDCLVEAGDDAIVLKNRAESAARGPTENVTISNCVLKSTSSALKIGTESNDVFRNITVQNCVIASSNRGLAIQLRDHGAIEDVLVANCIVDTRLFCPQWWGRGEPIYVTAIHRAPGTRLGAVRRVRFCNVVCRGENGVFVAGSEDSPIRDLVFDNVRVDIERRSRWPGGVHDRRPCMSPRTDFGIEPEKDAGLTPHPTPGFFIEHADGVTLRNTRVGWGAPAQDFWSHALHARRVSGLRLDGFEGEAGRPGLEARKVE